VREHGKAGWSHLFAGLIALGLGGAALFAAEKAVIHLEYATVFSTAPEVFFLKNQGLGFQRAAARAPNVLPIYGSSELLVPPVPEKGNNFFRAAGSRPDEDSESNPLPIRNCSFRRNRN